MAIINYRVIRFYKSPRTKKVYQCNSTIELDQISDKKGAAFTPHEIDLMRRQNIVIPVHEKWITPILVAEADARREKLKQEAVAKSEQVIADAKNILKNTPRFNKDSSHSKKCQCNECKQEVVVI